MKDIYLNINTIHIYSPFTVFTVIKMMKNMTVNNVNEKSIILKNMLSDNE